MSNEGADLTLFRESIQTFRNWFSYDWGMFFVKQMECFLNQ